MSHTIGKRSVLCLTLLVCGLLAGLALAQDNGRAILQKAVVATGSANVTSIQYSGSGKSGTLGQSHLPQTPWPTVTILSYKKTIEYASQSSKEEITRTLENPPAKGGGPPFAGEQKQVNLVAGFYSWNQPGDTPVPAPDALVERQLQILATPQGFLKQALISNTTAKKVKGGTEVSFTAFGRYKIDGTVNGQGMVEKVVTWLPNPVMGDMEMETVFTDYKDFAGVKFPAHIVQKEGGYMVLDLNVSNVVPNVPNAVQVASDSIKSAKPSTVVVESQKLADGTWFLGGGSHNSVLLEFKDYVAVMEAPLNETRSQAVIAEVKKLVPGKPIRYLVNTHHHFDHSGGLRTYVAEGTTIITHEGNETFYEQAWKTPRTLMPDSLSQTPKKATFMTVKDKYVLTDGTRSVELYLNQGDNHNGGILFAYLPKEKILIEADDFTPPAPNAPPLVPLAKSFGEGLYNNIQQLKLDVVTIAPLHGRPAEFAAMPKALGKS